MSEHTLAVLFEFEPADKADPMSRDDCGVLSLTLDGEPLPRHTQADKNT